VKNSTTDALRVIVSGRVQGVAFRYATQEQAARLGLGGWVRNLPDGRVEAFFTGPKQALEEILAWCWSGPRLASVTKVEHEWRTAESAPGGFRITG